MLPGETSAARPRTGFNLLLQEDRSFCGDGGRFGHPLCDWFVIGGRWSGYPAQDLIGEPYRDALKQRFPKLARDWYTESDVDAHRPALDALWHEFGGTGPSPLQPRRL